MDLPQYAQYGGSSTSPSPHRPTPGGTFNPAYSPIKPEPDLSNRSKLILPIFDTPTEKHLHPSLDLISLLHLDTLYNTFVRPYADAEEDDPPGKGQGERAGKGKKRRLEKGYHGLIEDCIDPTPLGERKDQLSLLPLISDLMAPPGPTTYLWEGSLDLLPFDVLKAARLEVGTKQEGYGAGEKAGVREAEEKRRRKKARHSQSFQPDLSSPALPSPAAEYPLDQLGPVAPPSRTYPIPRARRPSLFQGDRPFPGGGGAGRGGARPAQITPSRPQMRMGDRASSKRPLDGGVAGGQQKRVKMGTGSRSISPATGGLGPSGRKNPPGGRSRTEGI